MKPKLRFTEFNSDWNKTTLKNIAIINPKNENIPDKFIYIDLESVNKGILSQEKIISKSDAPSRAQRTVKKNDILFQTVRPYQQNNYFVKEIKDLSYVASTGYALIRTNENPYFIYSILHKKDFLDKVIDRCTGTSFPAISSNDLADININIPDIQEQTKISNFLSLIDKKIELQTKKIEDLKLFKKGLHNRLFNEVDGDDYLLSDIAIFENGKGHENIVDDNGEYVLIN
ncbi:MAG: restriction endonuclease subunit S, partial [Bacilli bacterium]|nr:restriction endonuclease subunit S [Bacilli bacterium]